MNSHIISLKSKSRRRLATAATANVTAAAVPGGRSPFLMVTNKKLMAKAAQVSRIHPKTLYAREMKEIRKSYLLEHQETLEKKRQRNVGLEELRKEEIAMQEQDIKEFKAARRIESAFETPSYPEKSSVVDWLTLKKDIFGDRESMREAFAKKEDWRKIALKHSRADLNIKSEQRLEKLVHLFHQSASFITYNNMAQEIDKVLKDIDIPANSKSVTVSTGVAMSILNAQGNKNVSIESMINDERNAINSSYGQNSGRGARDSERTEALKRVVIGTTAAGHDDLFGVRRRVWEGITKGENLDPSFQDRLKGLLQGMGNSDGKENVQTINGDAAMKILQNPTGQSQMALDMETDVAIAAMKEVLGETKGCSKCCFVQGVKSIPHSIHDCTEKITDPAVLEIYTKWEQDKNKKIRTISFDIFLANPLYFSHRIANASINPFDLQPDLKIIKLIVATVRDWFYHMKEGDYKSHTFNAIRWFDNYRTDILKGALLIKLIDRKVCAKCFRPGHSSKNCDSVITRAMSGMNNGALKRSQAEKASKMAEMKRLNRIMNPLLTTYGVNPFETARTDTINAEAEKDGMPAPRNPVISDVVMKKRFVEENGRQILLNRLEIMRAASALSAVTATANAGPVSEETQKLKSLRASTLETLNERDAFLRLERKHYNPSPEERAAFGKEWELSNRLVNKKKKADARRHKIRNARRRQFAITTFKFDKNAVDSPAAEAKLKAEAERQIRRINLTTPGLLSHANNLGLGMLNDRGRAYRKFWLSMDRARPLYRHAVAKKSAMNHTLSTAIRMRNLQKDRTVGRYRKKEFKKIVKTRILLEKEIMSMQSAKSGNESADDNIISRIGDDSKAAKVLDRFAQNVTKKDRLKVVAKYSFGSSDRPFLRYKPKNEFKVLEDGRIVPKNTGRHPRPAAAAKNARIMKAAPMVFHKNVAAHANRFLKSHLAESVANNSKQTSSKKSAKSGKENKVTDSKTSQKSKVKSLISGGANFHGKKAVYGGGDGLKLTSPLSTPEGEMKGRKEGGKKSSKPAKTAPVVATASKGLVKKPMTIRLLRERLGPRLPAPAFDPVTQKTRRIKGGSQLFEASNIYRSRKVRRDALDRHIAHAKGARAMKKVERATAKEAALKEVERQKVLRIAADQLKEKERITKKSVASSKLSRNMQKKGAERMDKYAGEVRKRQSGKK